MSEEKHKTIITDSLHFLVKEKRVVLYGFVIMSNHIHLIWQSLPEFSMAAVQSSFIRHTGKQLRNAILEMSELEAEGLKVSKHDRTYQIWKRESLSVELFTADVLLQKLEYIHNNPVKANICKYAEDYHYSSARFYRHGVDEFDMLTHFYRP